MRPLHIAAIALAVLVSTVTLTLFVARELRIDACMDHGGRWFEGRCDLPR
jgi:hypothetical protein